LQSIFENYPKFIFHSNQIGCWKKIEPKDERVIKLDFNQFKSSSLPEWSSDEVPYKKGSFVMFQESFYISLGIRNVGAPDHYTDYLIFV
jgi:hypothetical protein